MTASTESKQKKKPKNIVLRPDVSEMGHELAAMNSRSFSGQVDFLIRQAFKRMKAEDSKGN